MNGILHKAEIKKPQNRSQSALTVLRVRLGAKCRDARIAIILYNFKTSSIKIEDTNDKYGDSVGENYEDTILAQQYY
jgi:hypothetical protein